MRRYLERPRAAAAVALLLFVISCSQERAKPNIDAILYRVDNGLIDFTPPPGMFDLDSTRLAHLKTLDERMEYYNVPGVSIAIIHDNTIEWTKAYGVMDTNTGAPVTTETIFEAGSTSKLIAAVMALQFVQKGVIELDRNVNDYLQSWRVPENEYTREKKVTLRRLLTHRAGMPATNYDHDASGEYPTLIDVLNGEPPALNRPAAPELVPGSKWRYSNVAYNVIQLLLEDVSGTPFQQLAEESIFRPLGMDNSTFVYPLDDGRKKREAMPHDADGVSRRPAMHLTALAHGGLTTTPTDLAQFTIELMRSYQGKSEKLLSREMAQKLFRRECEIDQSAFPLPFYEGLGVFLMGEGRDKLFTHPGTNYPGLICWLIGWPERGNGAVIMANGINGILPAIEITNAFHEEYNKS